GMGCGLLLHPTAPMSILALPLGGVAAVCVLRHLLGMPAPGAPPTLGLLARHLGLGLLVYALMVLPLLLIHLSLCKWGLPVYPLAWSRLIPIALDVDHHVLPLVGEPLSLYLAAASLGLSVLLWGIAYRQRNIAAESYLLCPGLILVAWLSGT